MKKYSLLVISFLMVFLLTSCGISNMITAPLKPVESCLNELRAGNLEEASSYSEFIIFDNTEIAGNNLEFSTDICKVFFKRLDYRLTSVHTENNEGVVKGTLRNVDSVNVFKDTLFNYFDALISVENLNNPDVLNMSSDDMLDELISELNLAFSNEDLELYETNVSFDVIKREDKWVIADTDNNKNTFLMAMGITDIEYLKDGLSNDLVIYLQEKFENILMTNSDSLSGLENIFNGFMGINDTSNSNYDDYNDFYDYDDYDDYDDYVNENKLTFSVIDTYSVETLVSEDGSNLKPRDGFEYLCVDFEISNLESEHGLMFSTFDIYLDTDMGDKLELSSDFWSLSENDSIYDFLEQGDSRKGILVFEVPEDVTSCELELGDCNMISDNKIIIQ